MKLHLWGIDFRRHYSNLQRHLYLPLPKRVEALKSLMGLGFSDLIYLATCHRIEFFTTGSDNFEDLKPLWLKLLQFFHLDEETYYQGYCFEGKSALRHLLKVASSLESLTVGESQILGQLKDAYFFSKKNDIPVSREMDMNFRLAFETAKRIRSETEVSRRPVSLVSLGIERIQKLESTFPVSRVAVVGRGEMSQRFIEWLRKERPHVSVTWVNRTLSFIESHPLAGDVDCQSLESFLKADWNYSHIFTATASESVLFTKEILKEKVRRPCLFIDFAEPVDIEPNSVESPSAIIHIFDLKEEASRNRKEREKASREAEKIISTAMKAYFLSRKEAPVLKRFQELEPLFFDSFQKSVFSSSLELDTLVKKTVHFSREHVRTILRETADLDEPGLLG